MPIKSIDNCSTSRDEVQNAAKEKNMEALDGWVHHLRSSWMLMKAEQPLQELYAVIHSDSPTDGEITHAVMLYWHKVK